MKNTSEARAKPYSIISGICNASGNGVGYFVRFFATNNAEAHTKHMPLNVGVTISAFGIAVEISRENSAVSAVSISRYLLSLQIATSPPKIDPQL